MRLSPCQVSLPALLCYASTAFAGDYSILLSESLRISDQLHNIPTALSFGNLFENTMGPTVYSLEESAGFSDSDPQKVSIYGDSWLWTEWHWDNININDPLFDGAPAFSVPFRQLSAITLRYNENPTNLRNQGIYLNTTLPQQRAGAYLVAPSVGGRFPLSDPLMDAFSGNHGRERTPPPPKERRGFGESFGLYLLDTEHLSTSTLGYALQVKSGTREYLDFQPTDSSLRDVFTERFLMVNAAAQLVHASETLYLLVEHQQREKLFAELYQAERETARFHSTALFGGYRGHGFSAGLLLKHYHLTPEAPGFARDLLDPDGESLFPFFVAGDYWAGNLDLHYENSGLYLSSNNRFLANVPDRALSSHPLTLADKPYGRIELSSAASMQLTGSHRAGAQDTIDLGQLLFSYNLFVDESHALNSSGKSSLAFIDVGLKTTLTLVTWSSFVPFLLIAKTPVAITTQTAQRLDPNYQNGALFLTEELIQTTGGAHTEVADHLTPTNIYTVALGARIPLGGSWSFSAQGMFKAYKNPLRLQFRDGARANGYEKDGIFFFSPGETRYELVNAIDDVPVYFGGHFHLLSHSKTHLFSIVFSVFNLIGESPFGTGLTANDIGVVTHATANPNNEVYAQANLDADRAFMLKALFGYQPLDDLWIFLSAAHRDGQPFTFYDLHEDQGQAAFTHHSPRGSPFQYQRPLAGPREDFQLNVDLKIQYTFETSDLRMKAAVLCANLFDMANELSEPSSGEYGRASLEEQIPRSLFFLFEI